MINPLLRTFLTVADCGSFTKASEKLFISATAIMKQMNTLEAHLQLQLIQRSPNGITLTSAGEIIYRYTQEMQEMAQKALVEAKTTEQSNHATFCIGTSLLNPAKPFIDLWNQVNKNFPNYKLHLVPFEDNHEGIVSEIEKLGHKFDFLIGVCDSKLWLSKCQFTPLGRYKKMVAVSKDHPLAKHKKLQISDLYGQTLMMVKQGDSGVNDLLRNDLKTNHPQIHIEDTPHFYDLSVFNRCAETKNVLLTIECWKDVHPAQVTIPVDWDYSIPYGLLYSLHASKDVLRFIDIIQKKEVSLVLTSFLI